MTWLAPEVVGVHCCLVGGDCALPCISPGTTHTFACQICAWSKPKYCFRRAPFYHSFVRRRLGGDCKGIGEKPDHSEARALLAIWENESSCELLAVWENESSCELAMRVLRVRCDPWVNIDEKLQFAEACPQLQAFLLYLQGGAEFGSWRAFFKIRGTC